jgi:serine/threonine-protein kinase HipA
MSITADGRRESQFAVCVEAAPAYGLTPREAKDVIDRQVTAIRDGWDEAADHARLTKDERAYLWGRQILNPYVFIDYA